MYAFISKYVRDVKVSCDTGITHVLLSAVVGAAGGALGTVVGHGVRGVCDLQPQSAIHVLLHEGINHKTGKRVNRDDRLDEIQSLHCVVDVSAKAKRKTDNWISMHDQTNCRPKLHNSRQNIKFQNESGIMTALIKLSHY